MFLSVALPSCMAEGTSIRSLLISTRSADSIAISVPAPMAMPTSERARAGASFIPSPTMATFAPSSCILRTSFSLSSGSTSATTESTPTLSPMALAVRALSPVSITVLMPIAFSSLIAAWLESFTVSERAMIPMIRPSLTKKSGVLPSSASLSSTLRISSP